MIVKKFKSIIVGRAKNDKGSMKDKKVGILQKDPIKRRWDCSVGWRKMYTMN